MDGGAEGENGLVDYDEKLSFHFPEHSQVLRVCRFPHFLMLSSLST